jgi:hypothetical protein
LSSRLNHQLLAQQDASLITLPNWSTLFATKQKFYKG